MTTPREEQPPPVPAGPSVTTAPPRSRWNLARVPAHVGPARTSTVVLALLFVGIFALYLAVRPLSATVAPTGSTGGSAPTQVQQPAPRTTSPAPTTTRSTAPARSSATTPSSSTSAGRTTSSSAPATSSTGTGTSAPRTTASLLPTTGSAPTS